MLAPAFLVALLCASARDPMLHLRADTALELDSRGAVSLWRDLSPRGSDFGTRIESAKVDSSSRPLAIAKGLNGRPSIRFWGTHTLVDTSFLPLDSAFTAFFVVQDSNPPGWTTLIGKQDSDMTVSLWADGAGNFNIGQGWVQSIAKTDYQTIEPMLYEATWSGKEGSIYVAGRLQATGRYSAVFPRHKTTSLGANYGTGKWQGYLRGHVGEVLIYPGVLSDAERIAVEDELLARWGIERLGRSGAPITSADSGRIVHLRADTGIVKDAKGAVKLWTDLSPRGTHFGTRKVTSGVDSAGRPLWIEKGLNGRASVRFRSMQNLVDTTTLPLDSGFTAFIVAQDSNPGANSALFNKGYGDLAVDLWGQDAGNFTLSTAWVKGIASSKFQTDKPMLYEAQWDGKVGKLGVSGMLLAKAEGTPPINRNKQTCLGAGYDGSKYQGYFRGDVGEVLVFKGVLSDSLRQAIEDTLLARWGLARLGRWSGDDAPAAVGKRLQTGFRVEQASGFWKITDRSARVAELRSLDGTLHARVTVLEGEASLPARGGMSILVLMDPDGSRRSMVLPSVR